MRIAAGRSHCWFASTMSGKVSPRCLRTAATRFRSSAASGWPTLILMPPMPLARDFVTFSSTCGSGVERNPPEVL